MPRKKAAEPAPHHALRARALRLIKRAKRTKQAPATQPPIGYAHLIEELRTHQVELELQNEELRRTQQIAEEASAKYSDLFDFAPVGYFMLDPAGTMREVNFAGIRLLGKPRHFLIGRLFSGFLGPASRRRFREFFTQLQQQQQQQLQCEVTLIASRPDPLVVQLNGFYNEPNYVRLAATDISALKQAEARLRRVHEDLHQLAVSLQNAREEECTRIAHEVHDELGQALTLLKLDLAGIERDLPQDRADLRQSLQRAGQNTDQIIRTVQNIAIRLRPMVLDHYGLLAAIKWWSQEFQLHTDIACKLELPLEGIPKMDRPRETAAFRILQEILTNVVRHARATAVTITLAATAGWFICEVRDNGCGIPAKKVAAPESFGLESMRQRAALLKGEIRIHGVPGKGTTVRLSLPLADPDYLLAEIIPPAARI